MIQNKTNISVVFTIIAWCYVIIYCTCYITSNTLDNIFQLVLVFMMIVFVMLSCINVKIDMIGILFILLIFTAYIPDFFNGMKKSSILMGFSYLLPVIMYLGIINYYRRKDIPRVFYTIPVVFSIIISILSIFNFCLRFAGLSIESEIRYIEKWDNIMQFSNYGLGSFATWGSLAGKSLYRIQGYFIEPSKMAMFLIIPFFFLLEEYKVKKRKKLLGALMIVIIAFLFTMSRAGMISIIGTIVLNVIIRRKKYKTIVKASINDLIKLIYSGIAFVIAAIIFIYLLVFLSKFYPNIEFLSTGISTAGKANLIRNETVNGNFILQHFFANPFGTGFGSILELNKATNLANAFILWIAIGGIPALIIIVILMGKLLAEYYIPSVNSADVIQRSLASIFMGLTIHSLSYGTWMTPDYLIIIGFMIVTQKNKLRSGARI